jgi:hypothetical protein
MLPLREAVAPPWQVAGEFIEPRFARMSAPNVRASDAAENKLSCANVLLLWLMS